MYTAVHLFVRFHGAKARTAIYLPNYWVDGMAIASAFDRARRLEGMLSDAEIARVAKNYYREITAICHNWNDLRENELWKIELRGNEVMEGLEGPSPSLLSLLLKKHPLPRHGYLVGRPKSIFTHVRPLSARQWTGRRFDLGRPLYFRQVLPYPFEFLDSGG